MNYCGACRYINTPISRPSGHTGYPEHEKLGWFRCIKTGAFYSLTRARECDKYEAAADLEARRQFVKGMK